MEFNLRPYQNEAVTSVLRKWQEHRKLLLVLPTGSGKTIVFSKIIESLVGMNVRCLILAHRDELIRQAQDKLLLSTGIDSAIEKASETALGSLYKVTVGSVQSLMREKRLNRFAPDYYGAIIVDETHRILADGYQRILKYFNGAMVLGVTATPGRSDKQNLGKFFDELAYEYSIRDAIKDGWLCKIEAETMPIDIDMSSVKTTAGDYNVGGVGNAIEPYLAQIADKMAEHVLGKKILVFLPLIRTSKLMEGLLRERGFNPCHIDGKSTDRKEILEMYHQNRYDVLLNSMLLTEGYDQPDVDCVVVLRPTQSRSLYCQMIGRGTRICEGKDSLLILDFLWNSEKHNLCHPASLIAEKEETARIMTEKAKKGGRAGLMDMELGAMNDVAAQREDTLAEYLKANSRRKGKKIDPMAFGILVGDENITEYEAVMGWETANVTPKQAEILAKNGFDPTMMNKGQASKVLDGVFKRMNNDMASVKQVMLLQRFGRRDFSTMKFKEASELITRIKNNNWSADFRNENK